MAPGCKCKQNCKIGQIWTKTEKINSGPSDTGNSCSALSDRQYNQQWEAFKVAPNRTMYISVFFTEISLKWSINSETWRKKKQSNWSTHKQCVYNCSLEK